MNTQTKMSKSIAVSGALRLMEEAAGNIQRAMDLLRNSGQADLAGQISAIGGLVTPAPSKPDGARNNEAYQALLPKLLAMTDHIDDMTDEDWGEWVNGLPEDEFLEFITVADTRESLLAAVAEAGGHAAAGGVASTAD